MKPRTALKRYTPIRKRRATPRNRKTVIRLCGTALAHLRYQRWVRDLCRCQAILEDGKSVCGVEVYFQARFDGDPLAFDMSHIQSRGAGGSDTLENVRTKCHSCHMAEHNGRTL